MINNTQRPPHTERLWTSPDHWIPRLGHWPYCIGAIHANLVVLHLSKTYVCVLLLYSKVPPVEFTQGSTSYDLYLELVDKVFPVEPFAVESTWFLGQEMKNPA